MATSCPADLSDAEVELLAADFWADVTREEMGKRVQGTLDTVPPVHKRVD